MHLDIFLSTSKLSMYWFVFYSWSKWFCIPISRHSAVCWSRAENI